MVTIDNIQTRLIAAIKECKLSDSELARRIGVKPQQIYCYLRGTKMPAIDTLARLCIVLDVDTNYILCQDMKEQ